jgi:hypothetical protein
MINTLAKFCRLILIILWSPEKNRIRQGYTRNYVRLDYVTKYRWY